MVTYLKLRKNKFLYEGKAECWLVDVTLPWLNLVHVELTYSTWVVLHGMLELVALHPVLRGLILLSQRIR